MLLQNQRSEAVSGLRSQRFLDVISQFDNQITAPPPLVQIRSTSDSALTSMISEHLCELLQPHPEVVYLPDSHLIVTLEALVNKIHVTTSASEAVSAARLIHSQLLVSSEEQHQLLYQSALVPVLLAAIQRLLPTSPPLTPAEVNLGYSLEMAGLIVITTRICRYSSGCDKAIMLLSQENVPTFLATYVLPRFTSYPFVISSLFTVYSNLLYRNLITPQMTAMHGVVEPAIQVIQNAVENESFDFSEYRSAFRLLQMFTCTCADELARPTHRNPESGPPFPAQLAPWVAGVPAQLIEAITGATYAIIRHRLHRFTDVQDPQMPFLIKYILSMIMGLSNMATSLVDQLVVDPSFLQLLLFGLTHYAGSYEVSKTTFELIGTMMFALNEETRAQFALELVNQDVFQRLLEMSTTASEAEQIPILYAISNLLSSPAVAPAVAQKLTAFPQLVLDVTVNVHQSALNDLCWSIVNYIYFLPEAEVVNFVTTPEVVTSIGRVLHKYTPDITVTTTLLLAQVLRATGLVRQVSETYLETFAEACVKTGIIDSLVDICAIISSNREDPENSYSLEDEDMELYKTIQDLLCALGISNPVLTHDSMQHNFEILDDDLLQY